MYNFYMPSTLKPWIDRLAVSGQTLRYTADGPEGSAGCKRVIVDPTACWPHAGQPSDFVEPYLRFVLGFFGVEEVEFVRADGVAISPEHRAAAVGQALDRLPLPQLEAA